MFRHGAALLTVALLLPACSSGPRVLEVDPSLAPEGGAGGPSRLQVLLAELEGPAVVRFAPGTYHLVPVDFVDDSCANCGEPLERDIEATRGLLLRGRGLVLQGPAEGEAVLRTNSGYGVLLDGCEDCELRGLTITGGQRDWEPQASNAAVVVKRSTARVLDCTLRDNLGDEERVDATVVGIIGIAGREESETLIQDCRILRHSWDGIALYGGAKATILGNEIDGVDAVRAGPRSNASGGRGVGIGLTWDARAHVEGNLVRRYWKGIGVFVNARAELRRNVVEQVLTWGLSVWDAGDGRPVARIESNVVFRTGACGVSLQRSAPLGPGEEWSFEGNALLLTGTDPAQDDPGRYCSQEALAAGSLPEGFEPGANAYYANREAEGREGGRDQSLGGFRRALADLLPRLEDEPVLRRSEFWEQWGGAAKSP